MGATLEDAARAEPDSGGRGATQQEALERLARLTARLLRAPSAAVSLIEGGTQMIVGAHGLPGLTQLPADASPCGLVAGSGDALVVADAREDPRLKDLPVVAGHGIVAYVGAPLRDAGGTTVGSLCAMDSQPRTWDPADLEGLVDLAATASTELELRRVALELVEEARTDGLTGLLNRRGWEERATSEIAREERLRHGLVLAVLDLDRFKAVNDRLGHPGGDAVLRRCATGWRSATRPFDVLARTGGEEFAVLLPGTDLANGAMVVERLRRLLPAPVTCSAGVAARRQGESLDELFARADAALYDAKRGGRDSASLAA